LLRQWETLSSAKPWARRQCVFKCKNFGVCCASAKASAKTLGSGLRQIISAKALQCQVKIFLFDDSAKVLYNYYINRR
jgi:hypothetical protein